MQAASYADLLRPIPNAQALLAAAEVPAGQPAPASDGRDPAVQQVQYYRHHHHHHHHHHHRYRRYWYHGRYYYRPY